MKTIKLIEIIGYGCFSLVMWWAGLRTLIHEPIAFIDNSYDGAMKVLGVIALIIAAVLTYATVKNWREFHNFPSTTDWAIDI